MNKRELYESIMRNVAKEVKKALHENEYWDEPINASNYDNTINASNYVFIIAYNSAYDWFIENYSDTLVESNYGDPNGFVILKSIWKSLAKKWQNIDVYNITKYKNIDEFAEDYTSGIITLEDLENDKLN